MKKLYLKYFIIYVTKLQINNETLFFNSDFI